MSTLPLPGADLCDDVAGSGGVVILPGTRDDMKFFLRPRGE
jgi:hypothetical protein